MTWDAAITQFKSYLKLERSLSENSVEAYVRDVIKLKQFVELSNLGKEPSTIELHDLHSFIEQINERQSIQFSGLGAVETIDVEVFGRAAPHLKIKKANAVINFTFTAACLNC